MWVVNPQRVKVEVFHGSNAMHRRSLRRLVVGRSSLARTLCRGQMRRSMHWRCNTTHLFPPARLSPTVAVTREKAPVTRTLQAESTCRCFARCCNDGTDRVLFVLPITAGRHAPVFLTARPLAPPTSLLMSFNLLKMPDPARKC